MATGRRGSVCGSQRDDAAAQAFAFLVAGVLFVATTGALLITVANSPVDSRSAERAGLDHGATSLLDVLMTSQGQWAGGNDGLGRLGLANEDGRIDVARLEALQGGAYAASANGRVDYEEALASLGLDPDDGERFHLRIYPLEPVSWDISFVPLAYIGDYATPLGPAIVPPSTDPVQMAQDAQNQYQPAPANAAEMNVLTNISDVFRPVLNLNTSNTSVFVEEPITGLLIPYDQADDDPYNLVPDADTDTLEGDVYADGCGHLEDALVPRLDNYEILLVGSTTDHHDMDCVDFRAALRDWIMSGGLLIVFGSSFSDSAWLADLLAAGKDTINGSPHRPDPGHPALQRPNILAPDQYKGSTGDVIAPTGKEPLFDVLVSVPWGSDILANYYLSEPGSLGNGIVALMAYVPNLQQELMEFEEVNEPGEADEVGRMRNLMENLHFYTQHQDYSLQYGPTIPVDSQVGSAKRISQVERPGVEPVIVQLELRVWSV